MTPLIDIVTVVFNQPAFVKATLESLLKGPTSPIR